MLLFCRNIICFLFISITIVRGSILKREDIENKVEFKSEKKYPNGTVIGMYTYKDKDGSPVHIKYFADDSSYGVEVKSVKVFSGGNDIGLDKLPNLDETISSRVPPLNEINTKLNELFTNTSNNTNDVLTPHLNKTKKKANLKSNEYEVFLEKDVTPFGKYNKEKVRVYYDGNKKKTWKFNPYKPFIY